jgi:hypothetical protein
MADRAKKISELDAANSATSSDLLPFVGNTAGTKITKYITVNNFSKSLDSTIGSSVVSNGQVWYTANNKLAGTSNMMFTAGSLNILSNVELGIEGSGDAVLHFHGAIASNLHADTPDNFFIGRPSHPWNTIWVNNIRTGNLSYSDTGIISQMVRSTAGYLQSIVQNTSNDVTASVNHNVSNDLANSSSNYGEMGMNSSTFVGGSAFSHPSAVYVAAATSNLAIGTYGNTPVHIVVNSNTATTWTFGISGSTTLPGGPVVFTGTATTRAAVNAQVSTAGSNGSIYLSTAGKIYLRVDGTGVATTDWQRVTTTAVD